MTNSTLGDVGSQLLQQIDASATADNSANATGADTDNAQYSTNGSVVAPFGQAASAIEQRELPIGMIFDDGWAHSTQDVNQFRLTDPAQTQNVLQQPPTSPATPGSVLGVGGTQTNQPIDALSVPSIPSPTTQWKYVAIFQPDGRATEAEIRLKDQGSQALIRLRIRGFTGGVTIGAVERKKRLPVDLVLDPNAALDPSSQSAAPSIATEQTMNPGANIGIPPEANGLPMQPTGAGAYPSPPMRERRGLEPIR